MNGHNHPAAVAQNAYSPPMDAKRSSGSVHSIGNTSGAHNGGPLMAQNAVAPTGMGAPPATSMPTDVQAQAKAMYGCESPCPLRMTGSSCLRSAQTSETRMTPTRFRSTRTRSCRSSIAVVRAIALL
jgi:hypothetical protein